VFYLITYILKQTYTHINLYQS